MSKVCTILAPLQLGHLVNELGAGVEVLPVGILAAYGLARLMGSAFNELRAAVFATVSQGSSRMLARQSFEHLHSLDAAYLVSSKPGALSVVVSRATRSLTQVMNMFAFNILPIAIEFIMALAVMATLGGMTCAGVAASTIFLYVGFTAWFSDKRRVVMRRANKAEEQSSSVFFDSLSNCENVKYFQNERHETSRYDSALARFESDNVKVLHSLAQLNFGQQIIVVCGFTGILAITAARVMEGTIPVGDVVAIHGILAQMMQPLGMLGGFYRVTTQGLIDLGKLQAFLCRASAVPPPSSVSGSGESGDPRRFVFRGGSLEFRDVHFAYRDGAAPVLAGASLMVPAGAKVAIVGPSGSGKSTLLRLLYRLQDPQRGRVLIDDQDVRDMDPDTFREHLGIVPQDCALFNETVGYNIRYGRVAATDEEVQRAAEVAQIHETIVGLPHGYDTSVGERGLQLSGGERQRVGVARCLLRNPSIVLLDEATSALDVRTEQLLSEAVDGLTRGRTCLIVAHRLSTVQRADMVAFIQDGVVHAQGAHDDLLARSDAYRRFWDSALQQVECRRPHVDEARDGAGRG